MNLKNLSKTSQIVAKEAHTRREDGPDIGHVLRTLQKLEPHGDRMVDKCGEVSFLFVREMQKKAEMYGEKLKLSPKQWAWIEKVAAKVLK